jgi:DNA-binding SARP family transcriptional activator
MQRMRMVYRLTLLRNQEKSSSAAPPRWRYTAPGTFCRPPHGALCTILDHQPFPKIDMNAIDSTRDQSQQMGSRLQPQRKPGDAQPVRIYTLGRFCVHSEDQSFPKPQARQQRPLELLQALIAFGGRAVHEELLSQALWPDAECDSSRGAFDVTVHRLRRMFGIDDLFIVSDRHLTLNSDLAWVDAWAFEQLANHCGRLLAHAKNPAALMQLAACEEEMFALYQGAFLEREPVRPWTIALRERLRNKLMRHIIAAGRIWEHCEDWERANGLYRKGLEIDPLTESLYQRMIICFRDSGRIAEAMTTFHQCRRVLAEHLQIGPSLGTLELFASVQANAHTH